MERNPASWEPKKLGELTSLSNTFVLDAQQTALVRELTSIMAPRIGLDAIPCRGAWLQAIKQWQKESGLQIAMLTGMLPPERLSAALRIRDVFRAIVAEMLTDKSRLAEMDKALHAAYEIYMAKYNRR